MRERKKERKNATAGIEATIPGVETSRESIFIFAFQGVGKDQKSVSDYVTGMSIVGVDAKEVTYDFAEMTDPDRVNSLKVKILRTRYKLVPSLLYLELADKGIVI